MRGVPSSYVKSLLLSADALQDLERGAEGETDEMINERLLARYKYKYNYYN